MAILSICSYIEYENVSILYWRKNLQSWQGIKLMKNISKFRSKYLIYDDEVIPYINEYEMNRRCTKKNNVTIIVT